MSMADILPFGGRGKDKGRRPIWRGPEKKQRSSPRLASPAARVASMRRSAMFKAFQVTAAVFGYPESWMPSWQSFVFCDLWVDELIPAAMGIYVPTAKQLYGDRGQFEKVMDEALGMGALRYEYEPWEEMLWIKGRAAQLPMGDRTPPHPGCILDSTRIPLGLEISEQLEWDRKLDPNAVVAGPTRGGKSVLLQTIVMGAVLAGDEVFVADPKRRDWRIWVDCPGVHVVTELSDIVDMVEAFYNSSESRYKHHEDDDDMDAVILGEGRKLLILDEWAKIAVLSRGEPKYTSDMRKRLVDLTRNLTATGAASGHHTAIGTQYPKADVLDTTILLNAGARGFMGRASSAASTVVLEDEIASTLPGFGGRGFWRTPFGECVLFQGFYVRPSDVKEFIRQQQEAPTSLAV